MAPCALTALRIHEGGRLAAVGAADGSTAILQLCDGLADLQPNEKATFSAVRCASARWRKLGPKTLCSFRDSVA